MKKVIFFLPVLSGLLLVGCSTPKALENESPTQVSDEVEGSWQLVSYMNHASNDTAWSQYPDNILYQKHITPTHFTWVRYDKEADRTTGTGGGTYTHIGEIYVEDIHFFYPPGSDILGQSIPFTVRMQDGKWYHTGFAKNMEFDPETGEMVVVDSTKIEEIWERVEAHGVKPNQDLSLVGTWELVSYMEPNQEVWSEYPDFVGYIKHITPTHFVFIKYNAEGDEVMFEGGGTYSLQEDTYTENILFMYPSGSRQVGTSLPFSMEMKNDRWHHTGYIKMIETQSDGTTIVVDSSKVNEIWELYRDTL